MSIVRIGLAETKGFSDGYDAIFGGKKQAAPMETPEGTKKVVKKKAPLKKAKKK